MSQTQRERLTPQQLGVTTAPPNAQIRTIERVVHGVKLSDDYGWLKDPDYPNVQTPEILGYLNAENSYYEEAAQRLQPTVDALYSEMRARLRDDDTSVPYSDAGWLYRSEFRPGAGYRAWQRKRPLAPDWETFLDEMALADGSTTFRLGGWAVNATGNLLAWCSDNNGSERFTLYVKSLLGSGEPAIIAENTIGIPVWGADANTLLYLELNEHWRPYRVRLHSLGSQGPDPIVYEETDESFFLGIRKTQSRDYIVITAGDHVTNEVRLLPAAAPLSPPDLVAERNPGRRLIVEHAADRLFILTNDTHRNFRLVSAPIHSPDCNTWTEMIPADDHKLLRNIVTFQKFMVLEERNDGLDQIRILHYGGNNRYVRFPEPAYSVTLGENEEFETDTVRLVYQSMITPNTVFDYNAQLDSLMVRKVQDIPSGYSRDQYVTVREIGKARDGSGIPISIVFRKNFKRDGSGKLHIYGYGAYGKGLAPGFSTEVVSLLDRGFAYAIAHVRGGDEMGFQWYEQGKLFNRENTFQDFIDATKHLISKGYARPGFISASGRSAGGQLMGAIANMEPDLWRAILTDVPFVDALNTMMDTSLPLTPHEWPEWGNPIEDPKAFHYIRSYCPYQNIRAVEYPPMRITAGLHDPRVTYWEPAKWVAKLRALKADNHLILLKTDMTSGHRGKAGRFDSLREVAEAYAFLLYAFCVGPAHKIHDIVQPEIMGNLTSDTGSGAVQHYLVR